MLVIGLTGGIGSGKSTVANLFAERGIPIIDADIVAREVSRPDTPAFASIVKHFGKEMVLPDGSLDRAALRNIIFNDTKQRLWLENLLHPLILAEMEKQIAKLSSPYCIAVIPLLLEVEFFSFINRILVVDTPESEQIKRVMLRDKSSKAEVEAILHSQARRETRRAKAQDIIQNEGTLEELAAQVEKLDGKYREMDLSS
jgi:dephospho-CoA kinase